jgi:hypothetical protein
MGLLSFNSKKDEVLQKRKELVEERLRQATETLLQSDQYKLFAQLPDSEKIVDAVVSNNARVATDPVAEYEDTLIANGLRKAQVRKLTSNLYCTYINASPEAREAKYEDIVKEVADYCLLHKEIYNSINPDIL